MSESSSEDGSIKLWDAVTNSVVNALPQALQIRAVYPWQYPWHWQSDRFDSHYPCVCSIAKFSDARRLTVDLLSHLFDGARIWKKWCIHDTKKNKKYLLDNLCCYWSKSLFVSWHLPNLPRSKPPLPAIFRKRWKAVVWFIPSFWSFGVWKNDILASCHSTIYFTQPCWSGI